MQTPTSGRRQAGGGSKRESSRAAGLAITFQPLTKPFGGENQHLCHIFRDQLQLAVGLQVHSALGLTGFWMYLLSIQANESRAPARGATNDGLNLAVGGAGESEGCRLQLV